MLSICLFIVLPIVSEINPVPALVSFFLLSGLSYSIVIRFDFDSFWTYHTTLFWPILNFSFSLIGVLIWISSDLNVFNNFKPILILIYFALCSFTYLSQIRLGIINLEGITGKNAIKRLLLVFQSYKYRTKERYTQEIELLKSELSNTLYDFTMFQPKSIPHQHLDSKNKLKNFKEIVDEYKTNLLSWESKLQVLKSNISSL